MLTSDHLRQVLSGLLKTADITIEPDASRLVAIIISDEFAGVEEGDRQARVWEHLLNSLSPEEVSQVEFVFTSTHEESKQTKA